MSSSSPVSQPPTHMNPTSSSSTSILTRLHTVLSSPSPPPIEVLTPVLSELLQTFQHDAQRLDEGSVEVESTAFADPFPYLLLLLPLLRRSEVERTASVQNLEILVNHSSAKEVVLGLGERLGAIASHEAEEERGGEVEEVRGILRLYRTALLRIRTAKPHNFLLPAIHSILSVLPTLPSTSAPELLPETITFTGSILSSDWITKSRDVCKNHLKTFFLSSIYLLAISAQESTMRLSERYFMSKKPRYRSPNNPNRDAEKEKEVALEEDLVWSEALDLAEVFSLDLSHEAFSLHPPPATDDQDEPDPYLMTTQLGAFLLYSHSNAPLSDFRTCLPILLLVLGANPGEGTKGVDEALYLTWYHVQTSLEEGLEIEEGHLFTLIELLTPLAALSPNPTLRFLSFRLISTLIVQASSTKEEIQMMLLKDLIEDCPWEPMRIASIGILREVLASKFSSAARPSIFLSPLLLHEFATLLRFQPTEAPFTLSEFLKKHQRIVMEKLNFYFFLLTRDSTNFTGVRDATSVTKAERELLQPVRECLRMNVEDDGERNELMMIESTLSMVEAILDRAAR